MAANGILAGAIKVPDLNLPEWAGNPANADLGKMAGPTQGATTYTPDGNALVSGQLTKLLSGDSDYMRLARTRAAQTSAKRGLLNSSIGAGAGEAAAIDAGLPIASADANAFLTSQRDNAAAANAMARDSNQFAFQSARDKFQGVLSQASEARQMDFTKGRDAAQMDFTRGRDEADRGFRSSEADRDRSFTTGRDTALGEQRMREIRANVEADLQRTDSANRTNLAGQYRQASQSTYDAYLAEVNELQQADMDPDVKAQQIAGLQSLFSARQAFLNVIYSNTPQWSAEWSQVGFDFDGTGG